MFDVYQHTTLRRFRTIVPAGNPFPAEGKPDDWEKVRVILRSQLWPEAIREIAENGYCVYVFRPKITFEEIESLKASGETAP